MKGISFSSSTLKLVATVTMAVDHVGLLFFPEQLLWRIVGRLSFPLFAFLIAEGSRKTTNVGKYFFRLLAFAGISQVPYHFFLTAAGFSKVNPNIFFTLSAGLLALTLLKRWPLAASLPGVALICAAAQFLNFDYGAYGVLTILASALILQNRLTGGMLLFLLPLFFTLVYFFTEGISIQIFAAISVPFVLLYNGDPGVRLPRRLLYWFYPAHLLLLWLIWLLLT